MTSIQSGFSLLDLFIANGLQDVELPQEQCCQEYLVRALTTPGRNFTSYRDLSSKIDKLGGDKGLGHIFDTYNVNALIMCVELGLPASWTGTMGYPAGVVPLGVTDIGLPYGLMFVTRKWDEKTLIALM